MKIQLILLGTLFLSSFVYAQMPATEEDRPSRLEEGYGSNELLSDTLTYMPDVTPSERIHFLGDVRLRSQTIDKDADVSSKFRYRVRVGFEAAVNENIKAEFMMATGDGDPVSTNQDFGDSFTGKNIIIDVADVYYAYDYHSFIRAGKMKLPFYRTGKSQVLWDNDLRPEGAFLKHKLLKNTDFTAGAFIVHNGDKSSIVHEDNNQTEANTDKIYLYTAKIIQYIGDFRIGTGAVIYDGLKGTTPYVQYNSGDNSIGKNLAKGNSVDATGHYKNNYTIAEVFVAYKILDSLTLGGDFLYNFGADEKNMAYNISLMYGKLKKSGDFKYGYYYRDTQKDAVLGMYSDSDFAGGYTDSKGHQFMIGYQLAKNTQLAGTYINSDIVKSSIKTESFQRLHLDISFKF